MAGPRIAPAPVANDAHQDTQCLIVVRLNVAGWNGASPKNKQLNSVINLSQNCGKRKNYLKLRVVAVRRRWRLMIDLACLMQTGEAHG